MPPSKKRQARAARSPSPPPPSRFRRQTRASTRSAASYSPSTPHCPPNKPPPLPAPSWPICDSPPCIITPPVSELTSTTFTSIFSHPPPEPNIHSASVSPTLSLNPEGAALFSVISEQVNHFNRSQEATLSLHLQLSPSSEPSWLSRMAAILVVDSKKGEEELEFLKLLRQYPHLTNVLVTERTYQLTHSREEYSVGVAVRNGLGASLPSELGLIIAGYAVENLCLHLDARDVLDGTISSHGFVPSVWTCPPSMNLDGVVCWDMVHAEMVLTSKYPAYVFGREYTHAAWVRWSATQTWWRTLLRNNDDHVILIEQHSNRLGYYCNRNGAFRPCGFDITVDGEWHHVAVVGRGTPTCNYEGVSTFFYDGVRVGTADRVACGTRLEKFSLSSQGPGHVSATWLWNCALSAADIKAHYEEGRDRHHVKR